MKNEKNGFTIVELLIVVVVIAILASIVVVSYTNVRKIAVESTLKQDAQSAQMVLVKDKIENGAYPSVASAANGGKGLPASGNNKVYYQYLDPVMNYETGEMSEPSFEYSICNDQNEKMYKFTGTDSTVMGVAATSAPRVTSPYLGPEGAGVGPDMGPGVARVFTFYANSGSTVTMKVSYFSCTGNTSVQWQRKASGTGSTYVNISGATNATYTTPTLNSSYGGYAYRATVTNPYGNASTYGATMIMDFEP